MSVEERENLRFAYVKRKKDFSWSEKIKEKDVNILAGLELHKSVFSAVEQEMIVNHVYSLQEKGKMHGKDKNGNPPGILKKDTIDPIPGLFKTMIRRLVKLCV
ncbi:hypothetical protein EZV62_017032 [Acer yangbiense]|uniref:Uncharacterized protein n=1 Tax=Acer yangbiense TaxID=1000413 RepID=A0A5C7HQ54_9ROSI|nr:hypothetical protein EZV62_017032 [Acer yangbiense]